MLNKINSCLLIFKTICYIYCMKTQLALIILLFLNIRYYSQITVQTNIPKKMAPDNTILVEVKINKGTVNGFSKYQMDVPDGVVITESDSKSGNFHFESNRVKIVWVTIPTEPEFVISFKMNTGAASGPAVLNHKFYYLADDGKKEVEFEPLNVSFEPGGDKTAVTFGFPATSTTSDNSASTANNANNTSSVPTSKETPVENKTAITTTNKEPEVIGTKEPVVKNTPVENSIPETKKIIKAPESEKVTASTNTSGSSVVYKVQLGAYGANPDRALFKAISDKVTVVKEGGFYKAQIGNFQTKEDAVSKLNGIKSAGLQGFVVAYQNGVRVK